jgi:signal transduction histidine kinase
MTNRFKLTTGFLVISVAIFVAAALVITRTVTRNEEANVVNVISAQSSKDAQVIAGVLTGMMSEPAAATEVSTAPADSSETVESRAIATFLRTSGIVRMSIFAVNGELVWSSQTGLQAGESLHACAFGEALDGDISSTLSRGVQFTSFDGRSESGNLVSTYIPLLDPQTSQPVEVLEVARDVTVDLDTRISSARTSMFQTVFGTLGGAFVVLFGVVLSADMLLWRSRQRAVANERALADETVIATRLELENQQLRQLNEERDRFLSMVSHELRTPLTSILGFTDVLARRQEGASKERNTKHLEVMRRNGEHLNSLIGELLEISHIQSGRFEVVKEGFDLAELVEEVAQSAVALLAPRSQRLQVNMRARGAELHGDRKRVMQALMNLLSNASKYSPVGSKITLTVEQRGDSVRMSVGDEGNGIPEEDRQKLFQRFYRRDDEVTRSQSGLGLGLSIVKAIVEAHYGKVDVDSVVGQGTVMTITLPGARARVAAPVIAPEAIAPERKSENSRKRPALRKSGDLRRLSPVEAAS